VSLFLATWPAMGERERDALNEGVGEIMWSWNFGRDLNFWKKWEKFVVVEKEK